MSITLKYGAEHMDWAAACEMFGQVQMGTRVPAQLRAAFENSYVVCSAFREKVLVGFGRAISDGHYQSAIYDVVVAPTAQHQGVGLAVMKGLLARLPERSTVLIYAVPGKEAFYRKLGFASLKTGMGLFPQPVLSRAKGYIE